MSSATSYQILLKLVNIWLGYSENKKGELFFETECIYTPASLSESWHIPTVSVVFNLYVGYMHTTVFVKNATPFLFAL